MTKIGYKELKKTGAFMLPGIRQVIMIKKPATTEAALQDGVGEIVHVHSGGQAIVGVAATQSEADAGTRANRNYVILSYTSFCRIRSSNQCFVLPHLTWDAADRRRPSRASA